MILLSKLFFPEKMMEEDFAEREATEDWTAPLEGVGNLKRTAWNNVLSSPKPKAKHKAKPNPGLSRTEGVYQHGCRQGGGGGK